MLHLHQDALEMPSSCSEAIELDPLSHVLFSNRSACYASISDWRSGKEDAERCIALNPSFVKGFSRLGACHRGLKNWLMAANSYSKGLQLEPGNEAMNARAKIRESRGSAPKQPSKRKTAPSSKRSSGVKAKKGE